MEKFEIKFNHEQEHFEGGLGISEYAGCRIEYMVTFCLLSARCLVEDMYDSIEDAPAYLKSKTYILENALQLCKDLKEQVYLALIFETRFKKSVTGISMEEEILKPKKETDKKKSFHQMMMEKANDPEHKNSFHNLKKVVKNTGHNFEDFIEIVMPESKFDAITPEDEAKDRAKDIGEVLKKLFGDSLGGLLGGKPSKEDPEKEDE